LASSVDRRRSHKNAATSTNGGNTKAASWRESTQANQKHRITATPGQEPGTERQLLSGADIHAADIAD
jgi:hypothetical protein